MYGAFDSSLVLSVRLLASESFLHVPNSFLHSFAPPIVSPANDYCMYNYPATVQIAVQIVHMPGSWPGYPRGVTTGCRQDAVETISQWCADAKKNK